MLGIWYLGDGLGLVRLLVVEDYILLFWKVTYGFFKCFKYWGMVCI